MLERSRYGRPITVEDVSELSVRVHACQKGVLGWLAGPGLESGEALAVAGAELCALVTDLVEDSLAPSASGLFIVR